MKSVSDSISSSNTISVTLPGYTNLMLTQKNSTLEQITRYTCPVGMKYKATVVIYGKNNQAYTFGSDTRQDLEKWGVDLPSTTNSFGVDWAYLYSQERHPAFLLPGCAPAPLAHSFAQPWHPAGHIFHLANL